jgi:hypothetical protein
LETCAPIFVGLGSWEEAMSDKLISGRRDDIVKCHIDAVATEAAGRQTRAAELIRRLDDLQADMLKLRFILRQAKNVCGSIPVRSEPSDEFLKQAFNAVIAAERALVGSEQ